MRGKKYQAIKAKTPQQVVDLPAAIAFLKEHGREKFDETLELHVRLGVDPSKSDQSVRSTVTLPSGLPKQQRIVVFTDNEEEKAAALAAGAARSGGDEIIQEIITEGALAADITIATPALMPKLAKAAKILGPKGLMPNPKSGTVSDDPLKALQQLLGGQIAFKMDQQGNIHLAIAKLSWEAEKIIANAKAAIQAIRAARPAAAKGEFLRSVTLKSTMSPSIRVSS